MDGYPPLHDGLQHRSDPRAMRVRSLDEPKVLGAERHAEVAKRLVDPDFGPLVWLALVTGARLGELCAMRWRHLDPIRRALVIRPASPQGGAETWE
jgi:integrase